MSSPPKAIASSWTSHLSRHYSEFTSVISSGKTPGEGLIIQHSTLKTPTCPDRDYTPKPYHCVLAQQSTDIDPSRSSSNTSMSESNFTEHLPGECKAAPISLFRPSASHDRARVPGPAHLPTLPPGSEATQSSTESSPRVLPASHTASVFAAVAADDDDESDVAQTNKAGVVRRQTMMEARLSWPRNSGPPAERIAFMAGRDDFRGARLRCAIACQEFNNMPEDGTADDRMTRWLK